MKRVLLLVLLLPMACSENEQGLNLVNVVIVNSNTSLKAGEKYRLKAEVSAPRELRTVKIIIGNSERTISNFNGLNRLVIDSTFRLDPTKLQTSIIIRAEDDAGNFEAQTALTFEPYTLPEACKNSGLKPFVVAIPESSPSNQSVFAHGNFNNNTPGDNTYKLLPIPGTVNCFCVGLPNSSNAITQFNRGTDLAINQSIDCREELFGVSLNDIQPTGLVLLKWKDIDCN